MRTLLARAVLLALAGCATAPPESGVALGRLTARPQETVAPCAAGEQSLDIPGGPRAWLYVPESAANRAAPLLVFLHGAGGTSSKVLESIRPYADRAGILVLIPGSVGTTWDGMRGPPRMDARRLDQALEQTFARCAVDRKRIGIGGFSDGASYSLTLGLANGDLFARVLAFSPCGISRDIALRGKPAVFIAHGREDGVLPIEDCGRPIAGALTRAGYPVRLLEFDGKHEIPESVAEEGFAWFKR